MDNIYSVGAGNSPRAQELGTKQESGPFNSREKPNINARKE